VQRSAGMAAKDVLPMARIAANDASREPGQ
jgi:hypothetical protein